MKKLLLTIMLAACAVPVLAAAATPAPDSALLSKAKATLAQLQAGKLDRSTLAPATNGALSDQQTTQVESMLGGLGPPVSFAQQQAISQGGNTYAVYTVTFQNGTRLNYTISADSSGQITGFRFTPAP